LEREMWNKAAETMDKRSRKELQLERLRETVTKAYAAVPFYNKLFKEHHVSPDDIRSLEDLVKLPMMSKIDMRDSYPYGMLAVPRGSCVRVHASSGTTGKPTLVCYTKEDVSNWSEVMARSLFMAGLRKGDVFQVTPGYGLFTGGLGFHYGGERLGAMVVPTGTGNTIRQINLMRDLGTNMIAGIASYALHMAEVAGSMGVDLHKDLQVRRGIFGAEVWSDGLRKKIASLWDMDCYDIYGMSEMYGPGAASECSAHEGIHVWDDHFIIEVIDPETGEAVGPEEEGEIVMTSLTKEAMPMIRFRTRDLSRILDVGECSCGRTHTKIARIKGRSDDGFSVNGVKVFPGQVESVLMRNPDVGLNYQLVVDKSGALDKMTVMVEANGTLADQAARGLSSSIAKEIRPVLGFSPEIRVVPPLSIERSEGKAKRVLDLRKR
jgi:phenylacetate-CoA ligase